MTQCPFTIQDAQGIGRFKCQASLGHGPGATPGADPDGHELPSNARGTGAWEAPFLYPLVDLFDAVRHA